MNKKDLLKIVAEKSGMKKRDVTKMADYLIDTIIEEVSADQRVRIRGLGVFYPVFQDTRPVRNPQTGEEMMFVPRKSLRLKVGGDVVRKLNKA